jgi:hypothetical protein
MGSRTNSCYDIVDLIFEDCQRLRFDGFIKPFIPVNVELNEEFFGSKIHRVYPSNVYRGLATNWKRLWSLGSA